MAEPLSSHSSVKPSTRYEKVPALYLCRSTEDNYANSTNVYALRALYSARSLRKRINFSGL